jgi:xanthine/uracil permease
MAHIDEIKEILNTLRVSLSLAMGILVLTIGSVINRYDTQAIDTIFWLGIGFACVVLVVLILIIKNISERTKEIKEI